jgi:hypothetical protein
MRWPLSTKVLTIDRATWRRGGDKEDKFKGRTMLLNEQGFMCCLGFDALACGVTKADILDQGDPSDICYWNDDGDLVPDRIPEGYRNRVEDSSSRNPNPVHDAIKANDDENLDEPTREARVREALIKLGWDDVVFV